MKYLEIKIKNSPMFLKFLDKILEILELFLVFYFRQNEI